jgi:hypothetical protein
MDEFEELLNRIRQSKHPAYGSLTWDGVSRQVTTTVQFENGQQEPDEVVRGRALRYLEQLTAEERSAVQVEVLLKEGRPVRAVIKASTDKLPVERLHEMERQLEPNKSRT